MKLLIKICFFVLCLLSISEGYSQAKGTFRAYLTAGFNTSQISGDSTGGFNYWGLRGGAGAYIKFAERWSANMEINYTMQGSAGTVYDAPPNGGALYHRTLITNYAEVPFVVNYHDAKVARFGAGVVMSSLINQASFYNAVSYHNEVTDNIIKRFDLGVVGMVTFDIKEHFGVNLRMKHSIIPFNNKRTPLEDDMYHVSLSAAILYYF